MPLNWPPRGLRLELHEWNPEQLIYVDESACNERTSDRKYGWAPIGIPAYRIGSYKRSERWSILPAYTCDGFIDWDIIHGSYDADLFAIFVESHVIPHTTPFPGLRSIIIMDNARIHRAQACTHSVDPANGREYKKYAMKLVSNLLSSPHTLQT